jgi:hypothetical protein
VLALFLAEVAPVRNRNSIEAASFAKTPIHKLYQPVIGASCAAVARIPTIGAGLYRPRPFRSRSRHIGGAPWITGAAQIEERHDRLLHLMQSLDGFPDERIVDRGRIAVHKVVASGLHLPDMCRDPPMAEGRQVGFQRAADGGVTLQKIAPDTLGQGGCAVLKNRSIRCSKSVQDRMTRINVGDTCSIKDRDFSFSEAGRSHSRCIKPSGVAVVTL